MGRDPGSHGPRMLGGNETLRRMEPQRIREAQLRRLRGTALDALDLPDGHETGHRAEARCLAGLSA